MDDQVVANFLPKESEQQMAERMREIVTARLPGFTVRTGRNLLYRIEATPDGRILPDSIKSPMRGQFAFQTDILIEKADTPLVAIELKSDRFTSHDVITYSWKAERHKEIYPWLRYGFVTYPGQMLGRRFMTHNRGFDFAIALADDRAVRDELVELLRRQIASAEHMSELVLGNGQLRRYEATLQIDM
jgi:hypothetical protein